MEENRSKTIVRVSKAVLLMALALFTLTGASQAPVEANTNATPPPERVRYQVDAYYPPFTFKNDVFLYGFDPYLTNIIFTSDRYVLDYSTDAWENVYRRLVNGEIDLAGIIAVTEERKQEILFSKPLFNSYVSIYTKQDHPTVTLDNLSTLKIGVGKGYYTESILRDSLGITNYIPYEDIHIAVENLLNGEIDVIFENQQYMDNVLIEHNLKGNIIAQITNLYPRPHAYAISKQKPELVAYINDRIDKLVNSGFFEEIYVKYFYTHSDRFQEEKSAQALYVILTVLVVGAALVTLMQFVIRSLRKKLNTSMRRIETTNFELEAKNAELKAKYNEIHTLAYTNAVTGLPNKLSFKENVKGVSGAKTDTQMAILYMDMDNFKDVNDTYGHDTGDHLLRAVADSLRGRAASQNLYNFGADEFVLTLLDVTMEQAMAEGQRILRELEKPICVNGNIFHVTASMGISSYPQHGTTCDELLKNADAAMYRAKKLGNGSCVMYDSAIGNAVKERNELQNSLREALAKNEFVLYYQPQVSADRSRLFGFEALIRWNRPGKGMVPPAAFIEQAEENGMIVPIGTWVMKAACEFARRLKQQTGESYIIAVNVSVIQLLKDDFISTVLGIIHETQIEPKQLEIEITESCLLVETNAVIEKLRKLNEAGVRIALDDFGTGYSSLRYLQELPVNALKIDRYFIDSIATERTLSLVMAIVSIGHALGLELVAEGVETESQQHEIARLLCDRAQGYLINRPIPQEAVEQYIAAFGQDTPEA